MSLSLLTNVFRPALANKLDLRRYVISVVFLALSVALGADIPNQLYFAASWASCFREWAVTTTLVVGLAVPIAYAVGRAHLELTHAKREAERLARTDPLTGLANRRAFFEAAARLEGGAVALVIADIDRFKRINDGYGHAAGDQVIRLVAQLMQDELRDLGVVARVGGEEFALLCPVCDPRLLRDRLRRFRARVADEPASFGGQRLPVTVSAGVAARESCNFETLYASADKALYAAKTNGRDRIVDFDEIGSLPPDFARAG